MASPLAVGRAVPNSTAIGEQPTLTVRATNNAALSTSIRQQVSSLLDRARLRASSEGQGDLVPTPPPDHIVWALEQTSENLLAVQLLLDELGRTL